MKTLVVFYSRTGNTRKIGEEIAGILNCDFEEIIDLKKRKGIWGWIIAGKDATFNKTTKIKDILKNPSNYDLIVIGTPIWNGLTPAVRTYLIKNKENLKEVAFFCTMRSSEGKKVFKQMEETSGKKPLALLDIKEKEIKEGVYIDKIRNFCDWLKNKSNEK